MENRNLYLMDEIDLSSVEKIIKEIDKINIEDEENSKQLKKYKREPIKLYITTGGGSS